MMDMILGILGLGSALFMVFLAFSIASYNQADQSHR